MIYLDSSALVKLVREEAESQALVDWLNEHAQDELVSSALVEVEVPRALRRSQPGVLAAAASTLSRLTRIEITAAIRATAAAYVDPHMRSLDAIHLATADNLLASGKKVVGFVAYDRRLADAASEVGLQVEAPA